MEKAGKDDKKHSLWYTAALLTPVTHAASALSWPSALAMGLAALLGKFTQWGSGWLLTVQKVWAAVMAGVVLGWSGYYWDGLAFGKIAPLILLALALWTISVPGKASRIGCVLLWPLVLLLSVVLITGLSEIRPAYLKPDWHFPSFHLLALLLVPPLRGKGASWKLPLAALAVSIITAGVLSPKVSASVHSGVYELSRSLSLLGVAERFESLVAAAITLGFYSFITYLLEMREEGEPVWGYGGIAALIYLCEIPLQGWILAAGSVLFWLLLPHAAVHKKISKNGKKGIDKPDCT